VNGAADTASQNEKHNKTEAEWNKDIAPNIRNDNNTAYFNIYMLENFTDIYNRENSNLFMNTF